MNEEDEIELKYRTLSKEVLLGAVERKAKVGIHWQLEIKGKRQDKRKRGLLG